MTTQKGTLVLQREKGRGSGTHSPPLCTCLDIIGPLERSAHGNRFALVLLDYATRYPEAIPLRNISAKSVAQVLFHFISRVGIPKEILTD